MMWRKEVFKVIGAVAVVCLVAGQADAIPITVSSNGAWSNPQGTAANVNITNNGIGTNNQISWGNPFPPNDQQSSYVFTGLNAVPLDTDDLLGGMLFAVGTFDHNNFPVTEGDFTGADLTLTFTVPEFGAVNVPLGTFTFTHTETFNEEPCNPAGDPPCPDVVGIPDPSGPGFIFESNGQLFEFFLAGFQPMGGGEIVEEFITSEGGVNSATLFAGIRNPIPEPTTLFLLGLGLVGLGVISRRKKK